MISKVTNLFLVCSVSVGLVLTVSSSWGQLVYDGFQTGNDTANGQYADGADASGTTNGGSGWSETSWANTATRNALGTATGLTYTDGINSLVTTPGAISSPSGSGNLNFERDFAAPSAGSELWFSFLVDRDSIGAGFEDRFEVQLLDNTSGALRYALRAVDNQTTWSATYVDSGTPTVTALTGTQYDALTFFVGQITGISQAGTEFNLWINPSDLTNLGTADFASGSHSGGANVGRIAFVSDGNRTGVFDEIRVGTSVGDVVVVPEPSTALLLLLALATLLPAPSSALAGC